MSAFVPVHPRRSEGPSGVARCLVLAAAFNLAACGDDAPVGIPEPCVGRCVREVQLNLEDLILTPGDTVRLQATARSADGTDAGVRWAAWNDRVRVDSSGLVTAWTTGVSWVHAIPRADSTFRGVVDIRVVHTDSGGQPFLAGFRDAASGAPLSRMRGFAGRDSIDVTVSYVLGLGMVTDGEPHVLVSLRHVDSPIGLQSWVVPMSHWGRAGFGTARIVLTQRDARGLRLIPPGAYDLFALLRLADGRVLGEATGYRVWF